jgi:hypothetical protein
MSVASEQNNVEKPGWLTWLAKHREQVVNGLFVLALILAIIPVWIGIRYQREYLLVCLATALLPITTFASALWQKFRSNQFSEEEATRFLVMTFGGLLGLDLLVIGLTVAAAWWEYIAGGMEAWQGKEGWRVWVFLLLEFSGLAIMFLSLQVARTEERSNPLLRRLVYGYNAVLTGLLVLGILVVTNVLSYAYFNPTYDWTSASIYSLSSQSESRLRGLTKPTKIYVILPKQDELDTLRRMQGLLDNCKAISDKIQVEYLSPDVDRERVAQLQEKYKFTDRMGILVVYGTEPNIQSQFIKGSALYTGSSPMGRQRDTRLFKGESELMNAISFVSGGKVKPIVYFTQGNGELDINDSTGRDVDKGAGALKQRLEQDTITVKGLQFSTVEGLKGKADVTVASTVPSDAALVVVAGPQQALSGTAIKALREYMTPTDPKKAKGKLVALLDPVLSPDKTQLQKSGLEDLLAELNVQAGNDRVMQYGEISPNPFEVGVTVNRNQSATQENPIAAAFPRTVFMLYNVRTVAPLTKPAPSPDAGRYHAETLLVVPAQEIAWAETDLRADPIDLVNNLRKRENLQKLKDKITKEDLSVAVTVTEPAAGSPDPHAMTQFGEGTPRAVVVGDSTFISNPLVQEGRRTYYDLFLSMVSWLRERPEDVGIEPKKQDVYEADPGVNYNRMVYLPTALMLVGIIGLGTGVWVVRRK